MTAGDIWLRTENYGGHFNGAGTFIFDRVVPFTELGSISQTPNGRLAHNGTHLWWNSAGTLVYRLDPATLSVLDTFDYSDAEDWYQDVAVDATQRITILSTSADFGLREVDDAGAVLDTQLGSFGDFNGKNLSIAPGSSNAHVLNFDPRLARYDTLTDVTSIIDPIPTPAGHPSAFPLAVAAKADGGFWLSWVDSDLAVFTEHDGTGALIQTVDPPCDLPTSVVCYTATTAVDVDASDNLVAWVNVFDADTTGPSRIISVAKTVGTLTVLNAAVPDPYGFTDFGFENQSGLHVERGAVVPPPPPPDISGAVGSGPELGCGEYRVLITNRCGSKTVCEITGMTSAVEYSRIMDDTSEAKVVVNLKGDSSTEACCECLGDTRTWLHSMIIFRDGEMVWGPGPIYNLLYGKETVTVTARDVSAWLDVRVVHKDYTKAEGTAFVQVAVDKVVRTILTDALQPDDPCDLVGRMDIGSIPALMDQEASVADGYAGDIFRDLARNVLDFTVIGNSIVIRDQLNFGVQGRLTDDDFQTEIEVEERGSEAATKWYVNGNGVFGSCGGEPEHIQYLGLVEQVASEDHITDLQAVKDASCSRLQGSNPAPVYVNVPDGAQLSPKAGITMRQLIPGALIDVSLRDVCRAITVRQRLTALHVTASDGNESVGVTLSPLGTGFGEAGGPVSRQTQ